MTYQSMDRSGVLPRRVVGSVLVAAVAVLLTGLVGAFYPLKLSTVQKNDLMSFLSPEAESTKAANESLELLGVETIPGLVTFHRDGPLSAQDRAAITTASAAISKVPGVDANAVSPPQYSQDGTTAVVYTPVISNTDGAPVESTAIVNAMHDAVTAARAVLPDGVSAYPAGPAGIVAALFDAFKAIDGPLLFVAVGLVIAILLVVYRSPVLWVFPLLSSGVALCVASIAVYYLTLHSVLTLNGQSQGLLFVLILGAGTDYALLLIARYREELHKHASHYVAMYTAWRVCLPAICASAITVMLGVACLTFSQLQSNKSLGPVAAIGVLATMITMITVLPITMALAGRWVFWPRVPHHDDTQDVTASHGIWRRIAARVTETHRVAWIVVSLVLAGFALLSSTYRADGLNAQDGFTTRNDAVIGQDIFDAHFDQGAGAPVLITTNAAAVDAVIAAVTKIDGVSQSPGNACVQIDLAKAASIARSLGITTGAAGGACPPSGLSIAPKDGRTLVNVVLRDAPASPHAVDTLLRIRDTVHAIPGADAHVGGTTAVTYDVISESRHDRTVIIPIVLVVIALVLGLLLRSIVAPLVLLATVVLSYFAALGIAAVLFTHVIHYPNSDPAIPLFGFVFLVALGIDYNIFLMTRVREETIALGNTAEGARVGLVVTGGVITSAGVVLAATFAVLPTLPVTAIAQIGLVVAIGVLIDTFIVRSILVPALTQSIGRMVWWPSAIARTEVVRKPRHARMKE